MTKTQIESEIPCIGLRSFVPSVTG